MAELCHFTDLVTEVHWSGASEGQDCWASALTAPRRDIAIGKLDSPYYLYLSISHLIASCLVSLLSSFITSL